jgi:hypothetical protein
MNIPREVSDAATDALIELGFHFLPWLDPTELAAFLNAVLRVVARELRRAVGEERQKQRELIGKASPQ